MKRSVCFRWDEEFVARVDAARGLVSRAAWVRWAVERALADVPAAGNLPEKVRQLEENQRQMSRADVFRRATQR